MAKRTVLKRLLLTPEEHENVMQRAVSSGLSFSSFVRSKIMVLSAAEEEAEKDKWTCEIVQSAKRGEPQGVSVTISPAEGGFTFANPI